MKDFQFEDLESVEHLFQLPEIYIRRALTWPQAQQIARLALGVNIRYEADAVKAVKEYFETEEIPPTEPPTCNCPPANGTRWHELPVTWSYDSRNQVIPTAHLIRQCVAEIEAVCGIKFREGNGSNCNICITNEAIDGQGGTVGITYVPASGDRMSACGPMCGNIVIDHAERFTSAYLKTVMMHELLHAVGIPHNITDRSSIMFPQYLGPRGLGDWDIAELLRRYPMNMQPINDGSEMFTSIILEHNQKRAT